MDPSADTRRPPSSPHRTHFQCSYCQRAFGRVDHLTRHIRSHLQDKPFRCQVCDKAFGRQDLLKRHAAGHNTDEPGTKRQKRLSNPPAPRVSQACRACATAKLKCDEDVTCKRCVTKGIACEREGRNGELRDRTPLKVDAQSTIDHGLPMPLFEQHNNLPTPNQSISSFLKGVMTPLDGQTMRPLDQMDLNSIDPTYDPLRSYGLMDFMADGDTSFDDIAMELWDLPTSPSFYYNKSVLEQKGPTTVTPKPHQPNPTADASTDTLGRSAYKESALGAWEPSPRDRVDSQIKSLSILGESPQSAIDLAGLKVASRQFSPLSVDLRDQMLLLTLSACKPESKIAIVKAFPNPEIFSNLIESFFFHHRTQTDSFFHGPSFDPNQQSPELLLILVSTGSTLADSKILHALGHALHEVERLSLPNLFENANSVTRALWALQTFVLEIEMGLWSGIKRKMEIAESHRQMPFTMLRRSGRFGKAGDPVPPPLPEDTGDVLHAKWLAWVEEESSNRLVYHSFIMDTQLSISMAICPLISFSELRTPMPKSRKLWLAPDAEAWKTVYLSQDHQSSRISLVEYFRDSAEIDSSHDAPFCHLIILSGIWGMVWQWLQTIAVLDKPRNSNPALTLRQQEILQLLHRFRINMPMEKAGWKHEPSEIMYELVHMHLYLPFEEIELFAGKGDRNDARRALPILSDWVNSEESRKAIWHAGQVVRAAERAGPARLRGFYAIALYQANLAMWAYAVMARVNGVDKDVSVPSEDIVYLNRSETPTVQRFINRGSPCAAAIRPAGAGENDAPILLMDQEAVVDHILGILGANFSQCEAMPPLVENLQQLLDKLGRAAANL